MLRGVVWYYPPPLYAPLDSSGTGLMGVDIHFDKDMWALLELDGAYGGGVE